MRELPSIERLRELVEYNPDTGEMFAKTTTGHRGKYKAGRKFEFIDHRGYVTGTLDGVRFYMHRVAFALANNKHPEQFIDHINGNPSDNRAANLRDVSSQINAQNRRRAPASNKSSGLLGVGEHKKNSKWRACITPATGSRIHLGLFETPIEAHMAYLLAKRQLHEGNTL